jgi:hypothetical protein
VSGILLRANYDGDKKEGNKRVRERARNRGAYFDEIVFTKKSDKRS